jgi:hypothetical protein
LSLSWRFRNDSEFRGAEMGRLEAAIARLVEEIEEIRREGWRQAREGGGAFWGGLAVARGWVKV